MPADSLLSSANALLRQCEDVKRDAQHAMRKTGVTAEHVEQARSNTASSPFLQQLRQSTRLDTILSSVTAEVPSSTSPLPLPQFEHSVWVWGRRWAGVATDPADPAHMFAVTDPTSWSKKPKK